VSPKTLSHPSQAALGQSNRSLSEKISIRLDGDLSMELDSILESSIVTAAGCSSCFLAAKGHQILISTFDFNF
jgi:hypothetical protein